MVSNCQQFCPPGLFGNIYLGTFSVVTTSQGEDCTSGISRAEARRLLNIVRAQDSGHRSEVSGPRRQQRHTETETPRSAACRSRPGANSDRAPRSERAPRSAIGPPRPSPPFKVPKAGIGPKQTTSVVLLLRGLVHVALLDGSIPPKDAASAELVVRTLGFRDVTIKTAGFSTALFPRSPS